MRHLVVRAAALLAAVCAVLLSWSTVAEATHSQQVVVVYREQAGGADLGRLADRGVAFSGVRLERRDLAVVDVPDGDAKSLASKLATVPGVLAAVPNRTLRKSDMPLPPDDPAYDASYYGDIGQRHYLGPKTDFPYSIDIEPAWDAAFNGAAGAPYAMPPDRRGVTFGVLDTGYTTPDLSPSLLGLDDGGRITGVWNYVSRSRNTADDDAGYGHGTRVTDIIRARAGNGIGMAGVLGDGGSRIRVYKVLDSSGSGQTDWVASAIMDAADDGCKVINLSLGTWGPISSEEARFWNSVVDYAWSKGAIVVGAAGNEAVDGVSYPGAASNAIAVGAIDWLSGSRSSYSNWGAHLDLVAPAGTEEGYDAVRGVWSNSMFGDMSPDLGTSFSTPLVSGSVGLLWSLMPAATGGYMRSVVKDTAADRGSAGPDSQYGYGEIDVWAAYQRMMGDFPVAASPVLSTVQSTARACDLSWTPVTGTHVSYRFGIEGGPEYTTTGRTGRVVLSRDGKQTVYVRAYCDDKWACATATVDVRPATGLAPLDVRRYSGEDRYDTARKVSNTSATGTGGSVVLVSGQAWPDALSATVLARRLDAPLLLTGSKRLSAAARDEIARLRPSKVYIVGGTGVVTRAVSEDVNKITAPTDSAVRLAGADRYATAAVVAERVRTLSPGGRLPDDRVVIASGVNYPDALSAAPMASAVGYPILLTAPRSLPRATSRAMSSLGVVRTLVAGGPGAVTPSVWSRLPRPERVWGTDRYATSRALADYARAHGHLDGSELGLATGRAFPDALGGAVLLAEAGSPVLLADSYTPALAGWLSNTGGSVSRLNVLGGSGAVPYDLENRVRVGLRSP